MTPIPPAGRARTPFDHALLLSLVGTGLLGLLSHAEPSSFGGVAAFVLAFTLASTA